MGKTQEPGPDRLVDHPQDVEVTGALPMSLTTFVGRERELDKIRSLFREGKRLVTLVGIGGIGKTRLALELGFSANDLGWANVYFVELASLTNPGLVDGAVLESVGGGSSRSPLQAAVEYLRDATTLLVLDCCEHVLDAVRHVAEVLLRRCPSVTVLATSRSPLDIEGELVWQVPSLSMQKRGDAGETGASDAARLFADRASHVQARFELSEDVAEAVEAIVRQVDGIPLAIELAAARVRVLSAQEIASGLDDQLRLLRGGHRSDPRHQTIRASLDWSHKLLTDQERQLFARLSIFSGGFDLQAATAVCAGGAIVSGQVIDEIEGLVDKSLLAVERTAGSATRFQMLDFVRQYAAERLAAAGEGDLLADRHRAYFRELAERADRELWALVPAGRARLDDESPNLRAAIDDGCVRAPDDALAMVGALGLYWRVRGRLVEGVAATEQSLAAAPPDPSPGRALALAKLSVLSFWLGDFARTQSSATSALEWVRRLAIPARRHSGSAGSGPWSYWVIPVPVIRCSCGLLSWPGPQETRSRCVTRWARWRSAVSVRTTPVRCEAHSRKRSPPGTSVDLHQQPSLHSHTQSALSLLPRPGRCLTSRALTSHTSSPAASAR
jgi:non-specific serine/threonine protein kinase